VTFGKFYFAITLAMAVLLTGCDGDTITMPATQEATWIINQYSKSGPCDVLTLDRTGTGPSILPDSSTPVIVGWTNHLRLGADPFPCNRRWQHEYQGLVRFDFEGDAAIRSLLRTKRVARATLVIHQRDVPGHTNRLGSTPVRGFQLVLPSVSWASGTRSRSLSVDPSIDLPYSGAPYEGNLRLDPERVGSEIRYSLDTTVQRWLDGRTPNNGIGIIIRPQDLNETDWSTEEAYLKAYFADLELQLVPR
jgi:hypothetical protein